MINYSSTGIFGSSTTNVPTCDAWGNIKIGTATQLTGLCAGSGVSSLLRLSTGFHGITFSNPERFGGGAFVTLYTPEIVLYGTSSRVFVVGCDRDMGVFGATGSGKSAGVKISILDIDGSGPVNQTDRTYGECYINFASFCLSSEKVLGNPAGGTYSIVPGACGFGVTGATYNSHIPSLLSKRTATAYGTIVIPPCTGNTMAFGAYMENAFGVNAGISSGKIGEFDISFIKSSLDKDYCVILSGEYEPVATASIAVDATHLKEYSLLAIDRRYKDTTGFRVVSIKEENDGTPSTKWIPNAYSYTNGLTERINFMVFGSVASGVTYGQP